MNSFKNIVALLCLILPGSGIFICTCAQDTAGAVQTVAITPQVLHYDSGAIKVRQPDEGSQKNLLENKDYRYEQEVKAPEGFLGKLWKRLMEWLFPTGKEVSLTIRIIEWILVIGTVITVILLLSKSKIRGLFYGKGAAVKIDFKELHEDIHRIDFDTIIQEAIAEGNYRKAIRLYYLKILKELSDKNLINWKPGKTNQEYCMELKGNPIQQGFKKISWLFEYTWYGDFPLTESQFHQSHESFREFIVQLNNKP